MKKIIYLTLFIISRSFFCSAVLSGQTVSFDKYHDYNEVQKILSSFASRYENLCKLEIIGKSIQGRNISLVTISNCEKGKAEHKPAIYIDGGAHGEEVTSTEMCLYIINKLLSETGTMRK